MEHFFHKSKSMHKDNKRVCSISREEDNMQNVSAELTGASKTVTADPDDNPALPVQIFTPTSGNDDNTEIRCR